MFDTGVGVTVPWNQHHIVTQCVSVIEVLPLCENFEHPHHVLQHSVGSQDVPDPIPTKLADTLVTTWILQCLIMNEFVQCATRRVATHSQFNVGLSLGDRMGEERVDSVRRFLRVREQHNRGAAEEIYLEMIQPCGSSLCQG